MADTGNEDFINVFQNVEKEEDAVFTTQDLGLLSPDSVSSSKTSTTDDDVVVRRGRESPLSTFQMYPRSEERFCPSVVKELINEVMADELQGKTYSDVEAEFWARKIATAARDKVKELGLPKYKYVAHVVLMERRGAGSKIGARCLWDVSSDDHASGVFMNETIVCVTAVFGSYYY